MEKEANKNYLWAEQKCKVFCVPLKPGIWKENSIEMKIFWNLNFTGGEIIIKKLFQEFQKVQLEILIIKINTIQMNQKFENL